MADQSTETTVTGIGGRIGNAIGGVLVGLIMVVAAFPLLFLNEGRSVKTYRSLAEGERVAVSVAADKVDAANEGKLVHLSGQATTVETLRDPQFGVSANAIRLSRAVEMYQWQEKKSTKHTKQMGGSDQATTTFTYAKAWSRDLINSGEFKENADHKNPGAMPFANESFYAENVRVGAFSLSSELIRNIGGAADLAIDRAPANLRALPGKPLALTGTGFYFGKDPSQPEVGDLKVAFSVVHPQVVSILAQQTGNALSGYQTKAGGVIEQVRLGTESAAAMFQAAREANSLLTWILRAAGILLLFIGFILIFKPLSVLADVVPFIGSLVSMGMGALAFGLALSFSLLTIAIAWIAYRPVLGAGLLAVALAAFVWAVKGKKPKTTAKG
jgi:hypothetical protein